MSEPHTCDCFAYRELFTAAGMAEAQMDDVLQRNVRLRDALGKAFIAMRIAKALPGVSAQYDFDEAIDAASDALHEKLVG